MATGPGTQGDPVILGEYVGFTMASDTGGVGIPSDVNAALEEVEDFQATYNGQILTRHPSGHTRKTKQALPGDWTVTLKAGRKARGLLALAVQQQNALSAGQTPPKFHLTRQTLSEFKGGIPGGTFRETYRGCFISKATASQTTGDKELLDDLTIECEEMVY